MERREPFCRDTFDAELKVAQEKSKRLRPFRTVFLIVSGLVVIASFAGRISEWAILISLIPLVFLGAQAGKARSSITKLMRDTRLRHDVLKDTFDLIEYDPHRLIDESLLQEGRFNYHWDSRFSRDYIRARYRGVEFVLADVELSIFHLQMRSRSSSTANIVLFKGPWLVITSQKEICPSVVISQRKSPKAKKGEFPGLKPLKTESDVQMENLAFDETFWTFSDDSLMPYRVLTPHFMEFILLAREAADGAKHVCFTGDRVHVAVHNGRNLFGLCQKAKNFSEFRAGMEQDINYIKAIIDEFLLNEQLFDPQ
ncbi:MAG: DUF3137 domain-containing protein [Oscillospiraceae bacterium]|nr:DUF3137 domain-containing protein [Oscillospiraceae bacterium]